MLEQFHDKDPFSLSKIDKENLLLDELNKLTAFHRDHCDMYSNIIDAFGYSRENVNSLSEIPYLPVRVFKELELKSVSDDEVYKTMMSSGTSDQKQSKIFLNKENAIVQQKVLLRILSDFIGHQRLPMLVIDSKQTVRDRRFFTTRGATIMGLDFAARPMIFALNDDMSLDIEVLSDFLEKYSKDKFIIFGFTFMVWQHLFHEIQNMDIKADLSNGYLLTAGGWKKLRNSAVSNEEFKINGKKVCGIKHYVDHYGMAEQTGCIYAECEFGNLHASIYSDIIVRRYKDYSPCDIGERGAIQVLSVLPYSYPGHSLLTDDEGVILGEDDCVCKRKGKYIKVFGRIANAELRGCSDTYASKF